MALVESSHQPCSIIPESRSGPSILRFLARNTLKYEYLLYIKPSNCETLTLHTPQYYYLGTMSVERNTGYLELLRGIAREASCEAASDNVFLGDTSVHVQ